ncbi:MAG TPA: Smr/MutS family protein [Enhygromyxa sp.]|nr:Smr/MutS family protein [Enhygromyxa sp.]
MRQSNRRPAQGRGRSDVQDTILGRWLAAGRGDALRHLGWVRLAGLVGEGLRTDQARTRWREDLDALEGFVEGRFRDLDAEQIAERHGAGVAAACDRLPMLRPEFDVDAAVALLEELDGVALLAQLDDGEDADAGPRMDAALGELEDLDESLAVARSGSTLSVVELIGAAELCRASARLAALVRAAEARELDEIHARGLRACIARLASEGGVHELPSLLAELDRAIDRRGDEPTIAADASPGLAQARREVRAARQALVAKADRLIRNPAIASSLRDLYWTERDGRVVLPVRSDSLGAVRERGAIIHGSSGTGHTFYVEPATLVEDNNAVREAELRAAEEERKVLRALSAKVAAEADTLARMQRACVAFDLMHARWWFGVGLDAVPPALVSCRGSGDAPEHHSGGGQPNIELRAARHPLMLIDGVDVVPNDILLERGHALVISGPNAGGKTVALKTLGLLALMAAAGLALPCQGTPSIPVFRQIITDVGDDQSIAANLSTFSAHIGHVRAALEAAERDGPGTLVLLDEVAVGTDPEQGAALAEAILIGLVDAGATVVVTTHYDRLKLLATRASSSACTTPGSSAFAADPSPQALPSCRPAQDRFHNAAVGFDLQRLRPTFRLSLGVPGSSSAIAVARRLGLPDAVLAAAERSLGDEGVKIDELLRDIEAERQSLARTRERLEREQQRIAHRDREVRLRERRVLEGLRSRKAKAYAAATEQLRALERELKDKRKDLRRAAPERVDELPTRAEVAGAARAMLAEHRSIELAEQEAERDDQRIQPQKLEVGAKVRVLSMNQEGEVVALQGSPPKRAVVQLPNLRTTVKVGDLALPPPDKPSVKIKAGKAAPILDFKATVREQASKHFGDSPVPVKQGFDNTCDVRGQRYEDAQERVADFVSEALGSDQDVVLILHGYGGGALKKAVREVLSRLPTVKRQRPGLPQEGGDGVTVVWLE